jgi:hypothetical protein
VNELDLIRSFRADVPPPSGAAVARAGHAWRRERARGWRRRRWAPQLVAAGGLAAIAVAAGVLLPGDDEGRLGPARATAAETLRHAAAAQSFGLPRPLRPGEFWYFRMRTDTLIGGDESGYTAVQPQVREEWVSADGTRRARIAAAGPVRFPSARDRARWEAAGRPPFASGGLQDYRFETPRKRPFHLADSDMTYADLLALPRDAESLYARIRAGAVECECGPSVDHETFTIVADTLHTTPLPDDLRAAFLRAAALIPGIRLVAHERDAAGRPGIAVGHDHARRREALVFDSRTYELLGETTRQLARDEYAGGRPGQLLGSTAYMQSGIVSSRSERP